MRHRYYVSHALHHGTTTQGSRIPALELEHAVCRRLAEACDDPLTLAATIDAVLTPATIALLAEWGSDPATQLRQRQRPIVQALVMTVRLSRNAIAIDCNCAAFADALGLTVPADASVVVTLVAEATLTRTGRVMRLVQGDGSAIIESPDAAAIRLLVKARRWWRRLRDGDLTITELAASEQVSPAYVTRVVRLAFLSPVVTAALLKGRLRASVDVRALTLAGPPAACWREQAAALMPITRTDVG